MMLAEVTHLFFSASAVARFTECDIPKSSAWITSNRELAGYPSLSATVLPVCALIAQASAMTTQNIITSFRIIAFPNKGFLRPHSQVLTAAPQEIPYPVEEISPSPSVFWNQQLTLRDPARSWSLKDL
jgi:hypothetical protein